MDELNENKKFYWLKLKRDFFKRHDIRIIEEMPNGKEYVLFYLKLLLESIDHEGSLRFSDIIPYNEQMLSVITNTNVDIVRSAMKLFVELRLMEIFDDKTIYMSEVEKMIGSESWSAERVRRFRAKQKALLCNGDVTSCNEEIEIEKDKEIRDREESDKDINVPSKPSRSKRFVPPTVEEVKAYCLERGNCVDPQRFVDYYSSNGWMVGKNKMKDWKAAVRTWEQREKPQAQGKAKSSNPFLDMLAEGDYE
jgi:predicted phage replisome organizer